MRVFAIGDIHGCSKTFRALVEERIVLQKEDTVYCIGDYVDRGPDSKGVIDYILELREKGYAVHALRGNHEQLMLDSRKSLRSRVTWMFNGGEETLASFGARAYQELDRRYTDFFETTSFHYEWDRFILAHAGLDFSEGEPFANTEAMLWIRGAEPDRVWLNGRVIIHGHTPRPLQHILQQDLSVMIDIDAGCVYHQRDGMGYLVGLELQSMEFFYTRNIDAGPL